MDRRGFSQTVGLLTVMVLITGITAYFSLRPNSKPQPQAPIRIEAAPLSAPSSAAPTDPSHAMSDDAEPQPTATRGTIVVHVAGAVVRPGVYTLNAGSRVVDAISAAGGMSQNADHDALNLAAPAQDGSRIFVKQQGETYTAVAQPQRRMLPGDASPSAQQINIPTPANDSAAPSVSAAPTAQTPAAAPGISRRGRKSRDVIININSATEQELQQLPGVGPSLAATIVTYRTEHGPFQTVDDLANVRGVGPAKLDALRAQVTLY